MLPVYPILFKRDAKGELREYKILLMLNDDGTVTIERSSRIVETKSGKPGKPNVKVRIIDKGLAKRTIVEQAKLVADKFYHDAKDKDGYKEIAPERDEAPKDISQIEPMTAFIYERGSPLQFPVMVQKKYDGSRTIGRCEAGVVKFYSRSRSLSYRVPHVERLLMPVLCQPEFTDVFIDGEFMNDENRQWEASGLMRTKHEGDVLSQDYLEHIKNVYLVVYDLFRVGDKTTPYSKRLELLQTLMDKLPKGQNAVRLAPTVVVYNEDQLLTELDKNIALVRAGENIDGSMIRDPNSPYKHNRSKHLLKDKATYEEDFIIKDIIPAKNEAGGRLVLILNSNPKKTFTTRMRGDEEFRVWALQNKNLLIGKKATIVYATVSVDGVPQHPRMKEGTEIEMKNVAAIVKDY